MKRPPQPQRLIVAVAAIGATVLALAGCSSSAASGSAAPDALSLSIGTILPQTGSNAIVGPPQIAGVDLAVADINEAAAGITVSVEHKDSGDSATDIATQSATALIAEGVTAIVGTSSSAVTKTIIDQVTGAGVVQISGANTSPDLSTYEDDDYYWRTSPSDVLQGRVLGNKILADGKTNVSILYMNDAYGSGLAENVAKVLETGGATVAVQEAFEPASTDFNSVLTTLLAPQPDALVVISFDEITTIAEQLTAKGFDFSDFYGVDGNYGVISPTNTNVDIAGAQFSNSGVQPTTEFHDRLEATALASGGKSLRVDTFAPEVYDATVLLALAALQGGSTDGQTIRDNLQSVSETGTTCETFADCATLLADGTDIDYDGLSGPITFDANGDPTEAYISIFRYDAGNQAVFSESVFGALD